MIKKILYLFYPWTRIKVFNIRLKVGRCHRDQGYMGLVVSGLQDLTLRLFRSLYSLFSTSMKDDSFESQCVSCRLTKSSDGQQLAVLLGHIPLLMALFVPPPPRASSRIRHNCLSKSAIFFFLHCRSSFSKHRSRSNCSHFSSLALLRASDN